MIVAAVPYYLKSCSVTVVAGNRYGELGLVVVVVVVSYCWKSCSVTVAAVTANLA
jgi:hypothetical protein